MQREDVCNWIRSNSKDYIYLSNEIWDYAELQYKEFKSAELLINRLADKGFKVIDNLANIPTAFCATYGSGKPVIAILGEYDALDNLSQCANFTTEKPIAHGAGGHGCGHHILGVAGVAAAEAIAEYLKENKISGTVKFYGCPAEEGGAGKAFMVRSGCFKDVDAALTWHPSNHNTIFSTGTLANDQCRFKFKGISAHAGFSPHLGRSALDALELMNVGVNFLREHIIPQARIHYAITNTGGTAPNVVQAEAEAVYLVRAPQKSQLQEIFPRVVDIAKGAALMTSTELSMEYETGVLNFIPNSRLTDLVEQNLKSVLPLPILKEESINYIKEIRETIGSNLYPLDSNIKKDIEKYGYCRYFVPQDGSSANGSTDVGDVSWAVPTAQFEISCDAYQTPGHSWQRTAQGKAELANIGMEHAAYVMALTAIDLILQPEIIKEAWAQLNKHLELEPYQSQIPPDINPKI